MRYIILSIAVTLGFSTFAQAVTNKGCACNYETMAVEEIENESTLVYNAGGPMFTLIDRYFCTATQTTLQMNFYAKGSTVKAKTIWTEITTTPDGAGFKNTDEIVAAMKKYDIMLMVFHDGCSVEKHLFRLAGFTRCYNSIR